MKRLIIICEGQTEQNFCQTILSRYFSSKIQIQAPLIKTSGGGNVTWKNLQKDINLFLKGDPTAFITTFIDFYGLQDYNSFPNSEIAKQKNDVYDKVGCLEEGMKNEIPEKYRYRFIPNFIIHEFEALLFNDICYFEKIIDDSDYTDKDELISIFNQFPNPELINNSREMAPSKRLEKLINGYSKVTYGNLIAESIGIEKMKQKNPHFNDWITHLENI